MGRPSVRLLLDAAVEARLRNDPRRPAIVELLAQADEEAVLREASVDLRRALPRRWDGGWQPAEIVREARRTSARAGRVVAEAVWADHADRAPGTLHPAWAAQVEALRGPPITPGWLAAFARREGWHGVELATAVVDAVAAVCGVGPLPLLLPPPGGRMPTRGAAPSRGDDAVLAKVRALLAQAESTTFEAEAATFTAKAQELMARHAIDAAVVWEGAGRSEQPTSIRIPIDEPYANAKSLLLQLVAEHSRCKAVFLPRYALSSVVGFAPDVTATEVLFTSLLVQSQVALQAEAAAAGPGTRARSRSFRSSFLLSYAVRIGERLAEVNRAVEAEAEASHGQSLLPVLAARLDAVEETFADLFDDVRTSRLRARPDPAGWSRGRDAADRAELVRGAIDTATGS